MTAAYRVPPHQQQSHHRAYYGVHCGRTTGVFTEWDQVEPLVDGFPGAQFKKFQTWQEAAGYAATGDVRAAYRADTWLTMTACAGRDTTGPPPTVSGSPQYTSLRMAAVKPMHVVLGASASVPKPVVVALSPSLMLAVEKKGTLSSSLSPIDTQHKITPPHISMIDNTTPCNEDEMKHAEQSKTNVDSIQDDRNYENKAVVWYVVARTRWVANVDGRPYIRSSLVFVDGTEFTITNVRHVSEYPTDIGASSKPVAHAYNDVVIRSELHAICEAYEYLHHHLKHVASCKGKIYTTSLYAYNCIMRYASQWAVTGWVTRRGQFVANADILARIHAIRIQMRRMMMMTVGSKTTFHNGSAAAHHHVHDDDNNGEIETENVKTTMSHQSDGIRAVIENDKHHERIVLKYVPYYDARMRGRRQYQQQQHQPCSDQYSLPSWLDIALNADVP